MEPLQRYHCCELALGLYSVRRRPGAIPNCEYSFTEWRAQIGEHKFQGRADRNQLHEKFVEELEWIDEVMVSILLVDLVRSN